MSLKLKIGLWIFRVIPLAVRRAVFSGLAWLGYRLSVKHRLIVLHNLTRAFPEKSPAEIVRIAKASYRSFGRVVAEFSEITRLNPDNVHQWVRIQGLEHYDEARRKGKGVLLFSAHFGNWEIGNAAMAIARKPLIFIYRILDSQFLEEAITYVRATCGNISLDKENAMRPMIRALKKGETINILIDQNVAVYDGIFVDFFGRPACTTSGLALLALHTGAPVLPVFTTRMPDGKYWLEIGAEVAIRNTGNRDADVRESTQTFTGIIEEHIRKYPEQWFWMHQRWKTKKCQARMVNSE
ncbi:MAG: lysophospholipid acyltransferase family protein [Smithellaceae bacterium]|jgi:Kdo2-lipid IVA lauroyltransferase/acyltransferase|nr:lysophospholipid acyltransferase family protein [Desulfobacterales bacterium]MDD3847959.1 lysophospholipid acyltransferase family protein [Smithellaceae bacterium]HOG12700.1 lysophospholipid acyltransferase family protein [Smithellaceae bacterium]HPL10571.1 lysophospholipid acyltransferase family protein [Smithellaceae bacterium]